MPGLWAGVLLCVALMAAPAPFATLTPQDAGRVVARLFAQEAYLSLGAAAVVLLLERRTAAVAAEAGGGSRFSVTMVLALVALFCTVAGYFGIQPMLAAARGGQGAWTFGQLHAVSLGFFAVKIGAVVFLAWRVAAPARI
ncbi:MAG: DUF4149 domain-containing protein [Vitreoscilla sp.]|nr:DUF4149 domain-containing protein [Vitreoscilla sp.]